MKHSVRNRLRPVCRAALLCLALPLLASTGWAQSIGALQGTSHISPLNNTGVSNIAGKETFGHPF